MNEQRHDTIEIVVEIPSDAVPDTVRAPRIEPDLGMAAWIDPDDVVEVLT